jgi:MFS family permease
LSPRSHLPSRASGRKYSATPSTRAGSGPKWAAPPVRARTIGTTVTVGALGIGPLVAGGLAQWVTQPLTVPTRLAASRVLTVGTISLLAGLVLLVVSVRLSLPSLALFLIAGALIGAGSGAVFKGTSGIVLEASPPEKILRGFRARNSRGCA